MKICVSIAHSDSQAMAAACARAMNEGADLVELRLDHLIAPPDWGALLADRRRPLVATCRRPVDGGRFQGDEARRLGLLREAAAAGVDWVDVEVDAWAKVEFTPATRKIVSLHDLDGMPTDIASRVQAMRALGADVVKVVTHARRLLDNLTLLRLCEAGPVPTVAFCMGELGQVSRILAGRFGAPWTYAAADGGAPVAAGQLPLSVLRDRYRVHSIDRRTALYAVAGDPIEHSLSPHAHNAALAALGLNARYLSLRVPADELDHLLPLADALGIGGLSITLPHKRALLGLLDRVEPTAMRVGACNTVVRKADGWWASNTDLPAALATARLLLDTTAPTPLEGRRVLILGAGGVARAVATGLLDAGASVVLAARDEGRRRALALDLGCGDVPWNERHGVVCDLLVNGTPVGMAPHIDDSPFDVHRLRPATAVFDTIYTPARTALLTGAAEHGCAVASGVDMFVAQASLQFRRFTGKAPPESVMRRAVADALAAGSPSS